MSVVPTARIGKPAPDFKLPACLNGSEVGEISLEQFKGKYLVIAVYPLDWTFVCPTEILAFNDRVQEFRDANCEVIVGSIDSEFSHLAWAQHPRKDGGLAPMSIPMFADKAHTFTKALGCYVEEEGCALRGLYIIDDKGILRNITMNDFPVGRNVDEVLRLVKAFQFTDKHGEVCPANWTPGADTIVPHPAKKAKYFNKVNE
ncbi:uncharacterized protein MONBRDRAFT_12294 [Monosiga brevicollis MX1]|uniref:thioredoxin-dependent peroxiredoxin n=1 Tax=Monosiga brevicollis TaxID=81824 RepID=A9VBU1_MONBE|nr:uncharacterized protein MONBRDRAFT_12294 [Monosiga brevicollis MX1]EDQ84991.1 predicted protein [Monosiga brevicollis MX1]|eukprot:XP_001750161.1 hypothetical protein [Monosiga brevicollis MX1]